MALKVLDAIAQTEFLESRLEPSDCRVRIMTPARSARGRYREVGAGGRRRVRGKDRVHL